MRILHCFILGFTAVNAATFKNFPKTLACIQNDGSIISKTSTEVQQIVVDGPSLLYSTSASDVASGKCMSMRNLPYLLVDDAAFGVVGYAFNKTADIYHFCHGLGAPTAETGGYQTLCEETY